MSKASAITKAFYGSEPEWDEKPKSFVTKFLDCCDWYRAMTSTKRSFSWFVSYCEQTYDKKTANQLNKLPTSQFEPCFGHYVRILDRCKDVYSGRGRNPSMIDNIKTKVDDQIKTYLDKVNKIEKEKESKESKVKKLSIQDRMDMKANRILADIDLTIDAFLENNESFSLYDYLQSNQIKNVYCDYIIKTYEPLLSEIEKAFNKKNKDYIEHYSFLSKTKLKKYLKFVQTIIEDAKRYKLNNKKSRTRKTKKKSTQKLIQNLNYKKKDDEYKITSIDSSKIIKAKELWMFNTKTRELTHFYSINDDGLSVSGSTIQNYDIQKSISKKIRKSYCKDVLKTIIEKGKRATKKKVDNIQSVEYNGISGRVNRHCVLLKAYK